MNNNSNNRGNSSNNSNSNNNRRRGRGNRPGGSGGGGGGQQLNRIDSRARGNAPQLLEKYRKLAQDAHLNGDRVQAEYYLQFADHYFRVTADSRVRTDDQRARTGERWEGGNEEGDDSADFSVESDFPSFDQPSYNRAPREERPREERPREERPRDERPRDERPREDRPRQAPQSQPRETVVQAADDHGDAADDASDAGNAGNAGNAPDVDTNLYEPPANPFVRDNRNRAGLRPRRTARPVQADGDDDNFGGLDPSSLPPAISAARSAEPIAEPAPESSDEAEAKPRRGRPRKKPAADDAGGTLESVS